MSSCHSIQIRQNTYRRKKNEKHYERNEQSSSRSVIYAMRVLMCSLGYCRVFFFPNSIHIDHLPGRQNTQYS